MGDGDGLVKHAGAIGPTTGAGGHFPAPLVMDGFDRLSFVEVLAGLDPAMRADLFAGYDDAEILALAEHWRGKARPSQLAPDLRLVEPRADWSVWLVLAGRGFGKTRAGAEWIAHMANANPGCRIALVGKTAHDVKAVMVEGESGVLAVAAARGACEYRVSAREVRWANGSIATLFSSVEPNTLRGPQFHYAWCDEVASWPHGEAVWNNLRMGLRLGECPRAMVTTTPAPVPLVRALLADPDVCVSRGTSFDNALNLPPRFLAELDRSYGGTSLGRQEVMGEMVAAHEGALWSHDLLDRCVGPPAGDLVRVVVGVDPPAGAGGCGIVVAGIDADGIGHVLADASVRAVQPAQWAHAVAAAVRRYGADRVVAEVNNGGAMVEEVLRAADVNLPLKTVRASVGKSARAEPIAALYAAGRVRHGGVFQALGDELCGLIAGGGYVGPGLSPDRADALVWALSELMLGGVVKPRLRALL